MMVICNSFLDTQFLPNCQAHLQFIQFQHYPQSANEPSRPPHLNDEKKDCKAKYSFNQTILKKTLHLTRSVQLIASGRPDSYRVDEKHYARNFITTYQILYTGRTPAAETKSIGLPADTVAVMVFAVSLIEFTLTKNLFTGYMDLSTTYRIKIANRSSHIHLQFRSTPTRKPKNCKRMWLPHPKKPSQKKLFLIWSSNLSLQLCNFNINPKPLIYTKNFPFYSC